MMAMRDICELGPVPLRDTGLLTETAAPGRIPIPRRIYHRRVTDVAERRESLKELFSTCRGCVRCPQLAATRQNVVFGAGNANADLMFVGEAPGKNEDEQGLPFVGQAGKLLGTLLEEVGLARDDVFVANVLKCLRYKAKVQLGDGSWERIGRWCGRLLRDGDVGRCRRAARPARVTGWHATPLGERSRLPADLPIGEERRARAASAWSSPVTTRCSRSVGSAGGRAARRRPGRDRAGPERRSRATSSAARCWATRSHHAEDRRTLTIGHSERQAGVRAASRRDLLDGAASGDRRARRSPRSRAASAHVRRRPGPDAARTGRSASCGASSTGRTQAWFPTGSRRAERRGCSPSGSWTTATLRDPAAAAAARRDRHERRSPTRSAGPAGGRSGASGCRRRRRRRRLYFDVATTRALSELIAPYVPPSHAVQAAPGGRGRIAVRSRRGSARARRGALRRGRGGGRHGPSRAPTRRSSASTSRRRTTSSRGRVVHNAALPATATRSRSRSTTARAT